MDNNKRRIVIGLIGPVLDSGQGPQRWERWRPSVAVCQHEDLLIDRFELLYEPKFTRLMEVLADDIRSVSPETEVRSHAVALNDAWDFEEVYAALHGFAKSQPFDPDAEEYLVHITTGSHVQQICLFLLTEAHYLPGRLLQTSPPPRRNQSGPGSYSMIDLDLSKYDRLAARFGQEQRDDTSFLKAGIETRNQRFNLLIDEIERVAIRSQAPLLLTGPTGAGKSQLARRIFELKKTRRQVSGAFVEVNCATLRGDNAMSAMFGHVKGAFTGAASDRPGLLRAADGGLLFLDEIGELGLDEQAMLLRAVEEKRFLPVGSDKEAKSDFQLIAGTNRDLQQSVRAGQFREDLLARINLWTFQLPALRERSEDIEPNLKYELDQFTARGGSRVSFNKEAQAKFLQFATSAEAVWSGNFRDLNGAITRMATLAAGGRISVDIVTAEIERLKRAWGRGRSDELQSLIELLGQDEFDRLDRFDRIQLADTISACRSARSLSEAGRALFSASRAGKKQTNDADRLRKYLLRFGLQWQQVQSL
jgi:transcriptional regulatory protein RtcR